MVHAHFVWKDASYNGPRKLNMEEGVDKIY